VIEAVIKVSTAKEQNGTVLLVDQEPAVIDKIKGWLSQAGYHVEVITDSAVALGWWREHRPEVVICDVFLEGMDGLTLLSAITTG